ncbi:MAG: SWIM zinc finger family protein [Pseudomonadota bacterium]
MSSRTEYYEGGWPVYVPVAERKAKAGRKVAALEKKGRVCQPVAIEGRAIARTFWGEKWCDNLESYSDYSNRLPRGRTYVRNGSVIDLQIAAGKVSALVAGSEVYKISISVQELEEPLWKSILGECAGKIASLVELLQGRLSDAVMNVVTRHGSSLFPAPKQMDFRCSCPDFAYMCKHVAATLYGVGARLDSQPELLFLLRHVDPQELIRQAGCNPVSIAEVMPGQHQQLESSDLSALFGIELAESPAPALPTPAAGTTHLPDDLSATSAKPRQKREKTVTASELMARGIPRHMLQGWLRSGVLLRTEKRGVYLTTAQTQARVAQYLDQRRAR